MPTCARVTSLGIYLYVALDLPVRPGLSDPGPFYDHYHYGPPGPKCSRPREGASVASRNLMQSRVQPDEINNHHVSAARGRGRIDTLLERYSKNRVVRVVVIRAVDSRRRGCLYLTTTIRSAARGRGRFS